jgi:hypothetical protein
MRFPPNLGNLVCIWKSRGSSEKLHTCRQVEDEIRIIHAHFPIDLHFESRRSNEDYVTDTQTAWLELRATRLKNTGDQCQKSRELTLDAVLDNDIPSKPPKAGPEHHKLLAEGHVFKYAVRIPFGS